MIPVVIVPYRNREENLKLFIPAIKEYLPESRIIVVEQVGVDKFNKGSLINIGMKLASTYPFSDNYYYMFHDVDLIPEKVDYSFPEYPTHAASQMEQFDYKMPYPNFFGGCVLFQRKHFEAVNGFSNKIQGWGCEDDLFYDSFHEKEIPIRRRDGRFRSLWHERNNDNDQFAKNYDIWKSGRDFSEGYSTVRFSVESMEDIETHKHYKVNLG